MNETPSRNDSTSGLWGEIPCDGEISEYDMETNQVIINPERTFSNQLDYSKNNAFALEKDKKKIYDPIGEHIIQLRNYYRELNENIEGYKENAKTKKLLDITIPKYPENYPFSDTFKVFCQNKPKTRCRFQGQLSKDEVDKHRHYYVQKVLAQTGFYVEDSKNDTLPLLYLSDATDMFLRKFVSLLHHHKNSEAFCDSDNLWDPLETTLQGIGFGGICGLHTFYYEEVVKKHDILLNQCLKLRKKYKKLRKEQRL